MEKLQLNSSILKNVIDLKSKGHTILELNKLINSNLNSGMLNSNNDQYNGKDRLGLRSRLSDSF